MKTRTKVLIGLFGFFTLFMILLVVFGSDGKNDAFQPQEEFRLTPWIEIDVFGIDMSIAAGILRTSGVFAAILAGSGSGAPPSSRPPG